VSVQLDIMNLMLKIVLNVTINVVLVMLHPPHVSNVLKIESILQHVVAQTDIIILIMFPNVLLVNHNV